MIRLEKNGAIAEIQEMGAEMRRYRTRDGKERLWSGNSETWAGVAPVLFPVIGNLKNNMVRFAGIECTPPKHGFAKVTAFEVVDLQPDACSLKIETTPELREMYPFPFRLTVTHRLLDNGFVTSYDVDNLGGETMHFTIGGHPGFTCPMNEGEAFTDYQVRFETEEEGVNLLYTPSGLMGGTERVDMGADHRTLALNYETFDQKDTLVLMGLASRSVELVHQETGKGLRFSFPQSNTLAIWTKPHHNAPYVCLEPWNGVPALEDETGNMEDKPYHIALAAGERFHTEHCMEVI